MADNNDANNGNGDDGKKPDDNNGNGAGSSSSAGKFNQTDLDALAEKERKRGLAKGQADLLADLDFESVDDLKEQLADLAKLRESQMSESEKKDAEIERLKKERDDEKVASQKAQDAANQVLMRAAVMTEAAKADHNIHEQARPDVWAFVDRETLSVTDGGDVEGVEAAVKAVVEAKPYLVDNGQTQRPPGTPKREPAKRQQQEPAESGRKRPTVRL
jgi:hypothetical protein